MHNMVLYTTHIILHSYIDYITYFLTTKISAKKVVLVDLKSVKIFWYFLAVQEQVFLS